jgi:hypothetical protein
MRSFIKTSSFLIVILSYVSSVEAQSVPLSENKSAADSIKYYRKTLYGLYKTAFDSLRHTQPFITASERLQYYTSHSNGYTAFAVYGEIAQASYDAVNRGLLQNGFPSLKGPQYQIGVAISQEYRDRWILDFDISAGINNSSKTGGESVKSSFSNLFQVNFGYDFIRSKKINIYPYTGLALRFTSLGYQKPAQVNNNFTGITDIVINDGSVNASAANLSYQAGLGFDFVIHENDKGSGTMLFLKAGTDGIFGSTTYKIDGVRYDAQIKQGAWIFALGCKFFARH